MPTATKNDQADLQSQLKRYEGQAETLRAEYRVVEDIRDQAQHRVLQGPEEARALSDLRSGYPNLTHRGADLYQNASMVCNAIESRIDGCESRIRSLRSKLTKIEDKTGTSKDRQLEALSESRRHSESALDHLVLCRRKLISEGYLHDRSGALPELEHVEGQIVGVERELQRLDIAQEILTEGM